MYFEDNSGGQYYIDENGVGYIEPGYVDLGAAYPSDPYGPIKQRLGPGPITGQLTVAVYNYREGDRVEYQKAMQAARSVMATLQPPARADAERQMRIAQQMIAEYDRLSPAEQRRTATEQVRARIETEEKQKAAVAAESTPEAIAKYERDNRITMAMRDALARGEDISDLRALYALGSLPMGDRVADTMLTARSSLRNLFGSWWGYAKIAIALGIIYGGYKVYMRATRR